MDAHGSSRDHGVVVGYGYAGPFRAREAYRFTVEDSVYVRPDSAKQGATLAGETLSTVPPSRLQQLLALIGDSTNTDRFASMRCRDNVRCHEECRSEVRSWLDVVVMQLEL